MGNIGNELFRPKISRYEGYSKFKKSGSIGVGFNMELQHRIVEHNRNLRLGEKPLKIIEVDHSRGSLTGSNAAAWNENHGWRDIPLARVDFNGAAANVQCAANRVDIITSGQGEVTQANHKMDFLVPRLIGGNPATGGQWQFKGGAHTTYGPRIDEIEKYIVWGAWEGSEEGRRTLAPKHDR